MFGRLIRYAATLVAAGTGVFLFILFAQANVQDLREIYSFRKPNTLSVHLGRFYELDDAGSLTGPVCSVPTAKINDLQVRERHIVELTNNIGSNIPLITEWTKDLLLAAALGNADDAYEDGSIAFSGHTLLLRDVSLEGVTHQGQDAMHEILLERPGCERTVKRLYDRGTCVVSVFRLVRVSSRLIGVRFYDQDNCYVPQAGAGEPTPKVIPLPRANRNFVAMVSKLKVRSGLIDDGGLENSKLLDN